MNNPVRLNGDGLWARLLSRIDGFLLGMVAAVVLAWWWPTPGARGGFLHPELLNKLGVALIFWLHGLTLPWQALRAGTVRWQLHLLVQASTFIALPLLGWLLIESLGSLLSPSLLTGIFFLCALPSTVSTSVALTAVARGNVPAALFNATLSSLIGVFATPLWLGVLHGVVRTGAGLRFADVILDLSLWLLAPLLLGQLMRPLLGQFAERHKPQIHRIDRGTILLLIYTSFCDSFAAGVWSGRGAAMLFVAFGLCVALLATILLLTSIASRALGLSPPDRVVAIFCGSKKSLASGVPMARLLFGNDPAASVILLPLMLYHPLQLIVCGWLATRWANRDSPTAAAAQV